MVEDVVIVGFGPCGQLLAAELGLRGHRVLVLERSVDRYPLPRAGHVDDEIVRALQGVGIGSRFAAASVTPRGYEWFSADRRPLFTIPWDRPTRSSWRSDYIFFQPDLEDLLEDAARSSSSVRVDRGWEVTGIDVVDGVHILTARQGDRDGGRWAPTGASRTIRARYVVGADGANSVVRDSAGIPVQDLGFEETLAIVDVRLRDLEMPIAMPDAGQICDPARPISLFRWLGRRHCRWEFMLMPGEDPDELVGAGSSWAKLAEWGVHPNNADIVRRTLYTFRSLICERFTEGGVVLVGDAAHQMPPFLGQGMASGMRDVENLAWKLDLVLRGVSPASLLASYGEERRPHVAALTEIAIELGRILCETDPHRAATRDAALRAGSGPAAIQLPGLSHGLFDRTSRPAGGRLGVQGFVGRGGTTGRLEDLYPRGWHVLVRSRGEADALRQRWSDRLDRLGASVLHVSKAVFDDDDDDSLVDLDGIYEDQFRECDADVVVVRPDRYIYGAAPVDDADRLISDLVDRIASPGAEVDVC